MEDVHTPAPLANHLWSLTFPLRFLGMQLGRRVTIIRLSDGRLVLHSTGPFEAGQVEAIKSDLLFNLVDATGCTRWVMRTILGAGRRPAVDRPMRLAISDRQAFLDSIQRILSWDFDRIVVGHGAVVARDGKAALRDALDRAGFPPEAK